MQTIQMEIDDQLLAAVDHASRTRHIPRSAVISEALQLVLPQTEWTVLESRHAQGYAQSPVQPDEFADWEAEQVWTAE